MEKLKSDIINGAYSRMRISGLTVDPSPEDTTLALNRLEQMAAEFVSKNICVGYNFQPTPDLNDESGIPLEHADAFELCLAKRLYTDFGKEPSPMFVSDLRGAFSSLVSRTAPRRQTQYPNRMPLGKITRLRFRFYNKFYIPEARSPLGCDTIKMVEGEINDFRESFEDYLLETESISSFTINPTTALTIVSSSESEGIISYRVQAAASDNNVAMQTLEFSITTSTGRIRKREVFFELVRLQDA